jgi:hypothetical protein
MWSMEYNPNMFAVYESSSGSSANINGLGTGATDGSTLKKYGRFEKRYLQAGQNSGANHPPLSIFLVAGVLESKNKYLMQDAKGLDDVVKVSVSLLLADSLFYASTLRCFCKLYLLFCMFASSPNISHIFHCVYGKYEICWENISHKIVLE